MRAACRSPPYNFTRLRGETSAGLVSGNEGNARQGSPEEKSKAAGRHLHALGRTGKLGATLTTIDDFLQRAVRRTLTSCPAVLLRFCELHPSSVPRSARRELITRGRTFIFVGKAPRVVFAARARNGRRMGEKRRTI